MRKLASIFAACSGILPLLAMAIGVGNIEVKSGLNQPFEARVPLLDLHGVKPHDVQVKLAESAQYEYLHATYTKALSQLKIGIAGGKHAHPYIYLSSSEPIEDPILEILLEVRLQQNVLVREYTVLLDPPEYLKGPSSFAPKYVILPNMPPPQEVVYIESDSPIIGSKVIVKPAAPPSGPIPVSPVNNNLGNFLTTMEPTYGPVQPSETLWNVAVQVKPMNVTPQQMMVAIFHANPQAFENENMNYLKSGVVLIIPPIEKVLAVSENQARTQVTHLTQIPAALPASINRPKTTQESEIIDNDFLESEALIEKSKSIISQAEQSQFQKSSQPLPASPSLLNLSIVPPANFEGVLAYSLRDDTSLGMNETESSLPQADQEKQALVLQIQTLQKEYQWLQVRLQRLERLNLSPQNADKVLPLTAKNVTSNANSLASKETNPIPPVTQNNHFYKLISYIGLILIFLLVLIGLYRKHLARKKQLNLVGLSPIVTEEKPEEILPMLEPSKAELGRPIEEPNKNPEINQSPTEENQGVSIDKSADNHDVQNALQEVTLYAAYGQYEKAIALLEELLKQYPNEKSISEKLIEIQKAKQDKDREQEKAALLIESTHIEEPEIEAPTPINLPQAEVPAPINFSEMETPMPTEITEIEKITPTLPETIEFTSLPQRTK